MAYEQKANTGTIFLNLRKETDNQPDLKGQINVNGKLLDIALWKKQGAKGEYYSASISEPRPKTEGSKQQTAKKSEPIDDTSDLPF